MGTRAEQRNHIPLWHQSIVDRVKSGVRVADVARDERLSRRRIYAIIRRYRDIVEGKRI